MRSNKIYRGSSILKWGFKIYNGQARRIYVTLEEVGKKSEVDNFSMLNEI